MTEIIALLACLSPCLDVTTQRRLACIIEAVLAMTGRVTMLGISRWTEAGGSYRTVQRFFNTGLDWLRLHWFFIRRHLLTENEVVLISGDETTVTKAGKKTYDLDRFFSSLYGKAVPGLSFLTLSLISVGAHKSYPVLTEQVVKKAPKEEKPPSQAAKKSGSKKKGSKNKGRGRHKGSRNGKLEDFMNIRPRPVHNAANFAMFMINITAALRRCSDFSPMSVLDLKTWFRAAKYVRETLKLLPQKPETIFIKQAVTEVSSLGRVNVPVLAD